MDRVNLLVIGVLALAAVASAAGVVTYEDERLTTFALDWEAFSVELPLDATPVAGAGEASFDVPLVASNVSAVEVRVRVTTTNPGVQPASVLVEVTPPGGAAVTEEGSLAAGPNAAADVVVRVLVRAAPEEREVKAASPAAARAVADGDVGPNGTGTWSVVVRLSPGSPGPLGGVESRTVSGALVATRHEAALRPVLPEVAR